MRLLVEIGLCLQIAYSAFFMWVEFTTLYAFFFSCDSAQHGQHTLVGCLWVRHEQRSCSKMDDRQAGTFGVLEICPPVSLADTVGGKQETPSQRNKV